MVDVVTVDVAAALVLGVLLVVVLVGHMWALALVLVFDMCVEIGGGMSVGMSVGTGAGIG